MATKIEITAKITMISINVNPLLDVKNTRGVLGELNKLGFVLIFLSLLCLPARKLLFLDCQKATSMPS